MEVGNLGEKGTARPNAMHAAASKFGYGFATVQNPTWTLAEVLLATGGRFVAGAADIHFRSISTDSRTVEAGDLFLALTGERYDGHDFVEAAVRKGAAGLIVSRKPESPLPLSVVLVKDTLRALGDLAAYRRSLMQNLQVLAITGSSGKTTVKEMTAAVLAEEFNVLKTQGNLNNLIGLPLSLLQVDFSHDAAVLEMGMNQPGEIARLAKIADPDIACIINVHGAHLEGLGDIEGVARAKAELFAEAKPWGTLVVNADDKRVRTLARRYRHEKITFGRRRGAFVRATRLLSLGEKGMAFTLHIGDRKIRAKTVGMGEHNVLNALAAAAMAHAAGMDIYAIAAGIAAFRPYDKRLQVEQLASGLKLINDSYNANPASVRAAFDTLNGLRGNGKTAVVLGDMLELGKYSRMAHRAAGEAVFSHGFDYLLAFGSFAGEVVEGARSAGMAKERASRFETKKELCAFLRRLEVSGELAAGDWFLVKGSRGMHMESIVEGMKKGEKI